MPKNVTIFVAGADKAIGKAGIESLELAGYTGIIRSKEPALTDQAAGKSGGISLNRSFPADLIYEDLMAKANVIYTPHVSGVDKLLSLSISNSCSYPRLWDQPIKGAYLDIRWE